MDAEVENQENRVGSLNRATQKQVPDEAFARRPGESSSLALFGFILPRSDPRFLAFYQSPWLSSSWLRLEIDRRQSG
jgi:hypothetical protein